MPEQLDLFASLAAGTEPPKPAVPDTFTAAPRATAPAPRARQSTGPAPRPERVSMPHPSEGAHRRAMSIAEDVAAAWFKQHGSHRIEMPIGLVAALTLVRQKDESGPDLAQQILAQQPRQLLVMYRDIWATHWMQRPDLIDRARILHDWLNGDVDEQHLHLIRRVTETALKRGLLTLTGHADPYHRSETDILSPLIMMMRSHGAQQGLGEYHTPAPVADAMAEAVLHGLSVELTNIVKSPEAGEHIHDPASGTGGLIRSAAQSIRHRGLNPHHFQWSMVDVDPIAAACAAVNAIVWDLGPRVTVACDDSLANPNAVQDAMREARAVFEHRDSVISCARILAAARKTQQVLEEVTAA
ncbi:N-6 DNA methylase [Streptomyces sp. NPDC047968]|uniref:N-6 DNA methylase n=1 Tax=unclassified Streptomyces TaxID=2593676 RepID=UPI0034459FB7